ncbi:recombinase family protein [Oscillatoria sp. CS-180]|uniref:recombinase family protein n=1 Tax=Oscillatoria sp. CS-180 TaxID=3021720 RepID=UPI00232AFFD4|nr:recombinase family protein [Oscillatoria sp. CS-180]MDB9526979.1 recombinase family protein [Oscillatoria sp. CS-180]
MLIGYEWIADTDSEAVQEDQRRALLNAGVEASDIYQDVEAERPALQTCLDAVQAGDTLVAWQLERLADSRSHLLELLQVFWQRKVGLKVLTGHGAVLDTTQLSLDVAINLITALTELETQVLRKRTLKAQAEARARGQAIGPRRKMTAEMIQQAMVYMTESDTSATEIAALLGITRATLYNYLNGDGSPKPAALKILQAKGER